VSALEMLIMVGVVILITISISAFAMVATFKR